MVARRQAFSAAILLLGVVSTSFAADEMAPIVAEIRAAKTPKAATAAFDWGRTRNRLHLGVHSAYMGRMLELGQPEQAYQAARVLAHLSDGNGVAWAVVAWHHVEAREFYDAFLAVLKAGVLLPDSDFVQGLAGRLLAWRDALGPQLHLSPSKQAACEEIRQLLGDRKAFREGYQKIRSEVARLSSKTPIAAPAPSGVSLASKAKGVDYALNVRASGKSDSLAWSIAWSTVRAAPGNVGYHRSGATLGPLVVGTVRSYYIPKRHYVHHGNHARTRQVTWFAPTPQAAAQLQQYAQTHGDPPGTLPNVSGILIPAEGAVNPDAPSPSSGRPPLRRARDFRRRPTTFSAAPSSTPALLRSNPSALVVGPRSTSRMLAGPGSRGALGVRNLGRPVVAPRHAPVNPFHAARSRTRAPRRVSINGNTHVR
jgi:hypothetical protein